MLEIIFLILTLIFHCCKFFYTLTSLKQSLSLSLCRKLKSVSFYTISPKQNVRQAAVRKKATLPTLESYRATFDTHPRRSFNYGFCISYDKEGSERANVTLMHDH